MYKRSFSTIIICFMMSITAISQHKPAYILYDKDGNKTNFDIMIQDMNNAQVILFGELHNNPIAHWLQLELCHALQNKPLILGAEMFEADNQQGLHLYLNDSIDRKALDSTLRLWNNYKTDYAPLVDFAKENKFPFIATNIPRRYASMVYKQDFQALDSLSNEEKQWIAPLPIFYDENVPCYKNMLNMMGSHASPTFPKAQAIKDATMAHFIIRNYQAGHVFIHFNGAYHSDNYEGILWYLKKIKPDWIYKTISTVSQQDINSLEPENKGKADYIICVDENMTSTY